MPGGEYTFQVQAANNEGLWNEEIFELPIQIGIPLWQRRWVQALALLTIIAGIFMYNRYRINKIREKEMLKADFERRLAKMEMSALRAQMNPHFLFNSLNSIDNFIIKNEPRKASEHLNSFARLIRLILQNSRSNYVNLEDELEALELYIKMERLRFKEKFGYQIAIQQGLEVSEIDIPSMLIQPFIKNAIWHGLLHKDNKSEGKLQIDNKT